MIGGEGTLLHTTDGGEHCERYAVVASNRARLLTSEIAEAFFAAIHGQRRGNASHRSSADPEARLARKGSGEEAKLCYAGHTLIENRHGLIVDLELTQASGTAEREAGLRLLAEERGRRGRGRMSVTADKGYDTADFVAGARALHVTPHMTRKKRGSAIDGRTTRHESYAVSLRRRKRIEEGYGWMKDVCGLRKLRHRGQAKVAALFAFACPAYNLVRL